VIYIKYLFTRVKREKDVQPALEKARKAQEDWNKVIADFAQGQEAFRGALGISSGVDKFIKDFVKNLPSKIEKTFTFAPKFEGKTKDAEEAIKVILQEAIHATEKGTFEWNPNLKITETKADDIGKTIIETIDKSFGGHKNVPAELKNFETLIANLVSGPDTKTKLLNLIGPGLTGDLFKAVLPPPTAADVPKWVSDPQKNFLGLTAKQLGLGGSGGAANQFQITIPKPITKDFDAGITTVKTTATTSLTAISTTLAKVSAIKVPPPNESKYQKGLQLAINNAAQTTKFIKQALDKIAKISVPAPKFNNFNSALDQAVSDTKRAVREINNALKNINKPSSRGGNGSGPGATTGPFAEGGSVIANTRTTATFGEAGPELAMFIPLKGGRGSSGSGGGGGGGGDIVVNLNISGNEIVDERKITRRVKGALGSNRFTMGA
jgi:hypothetical protein